MFSLFSAQARPERRLTEKNFQLFYFFFMSFVAAGFMCYPSLMKASVATEGD
jgi:hypothetical protein